MSPGFDGFVGWCMTPVEYAPLRQKDSTVLTTQLCAQSVIGGGKDQGTWKTPSCMHIGLLTLVLLEFTFLAGCVLSVLQGESSPECRV